VTAPHDAPLVLLAVASIAGYVVAGARGIYAS
jgi:hypothetical protein